MTRAEREVAQAEARRLYEAGHDMEEIGSRFGVGAGAVMDWQRRTGGWDSAARSHGRTRLRYPWVDTARERYEHGEGLADLASEYGISDRTLHAIKSREDWGQEAHEKAKRRGGVDVPAGHRRCTECETVKPLEDYDRKTSDPDPARRHDWHPRCRECRRGWRKEQGEHCRPELLARHRLRLWRETGKVSLSLEGKRRRARFRKHLALVERALKPKGVGQRVCLRCARTFSATRERHTFCSKACCWREMRSRRRAREREAFVENVDLSDVYQRDGGRCGICGGHVDRRCKYPHPRAPVLDHIVPLARGGMHERRNVQIAHHRCNDIKKTRAVGSQLRLLG